MVNKIFRAAGLSARTSTTCLRFSFYVLLPKRHSINSGPLCATDHLFATRVIKVNESSAARVASGRWRDGSWNRVTPGVFSEKS